MYDVKYHKLRLLIISGKPKSIFAFPESSVLLTTLICKLQTLCCSFSLLVGFFLGTGLNLRIVFCFVCSSIIFCFGMLLWFVFNKLFALSMLGLFCFLCSWPGKVPQSLSASLRGSAALPTFGSEPRALGLFGATLGAADLLPRGQKGGPFVWGAAGGGFSLVDWVFLVDLRRLRWL